MGRYATGDGKVEDACKQEATRLFYSALNVTEKDKTLIVLAGRPPSMDLLSWRYEESDRVIAVDGGWQPFQDSGLHPDVLIGDFDSCPDIDGLRQENPGLEVIHSIDQENTDFEKALVWTEANTETRELVVLGGLGQRSDHFITNLLICCKMNPDWCVIFDDPSEWIRRVTPDTPLSLVGRKGSVLSILPLTPCLGVSSSGLKWNLLDEEISFSKKLGQSNFCESDYVEVSCETGNLFVFLSKLIQSD